MIRAVIIEDEDFAVQRLRMILEEQEEPIRVIATLTGIRQAVKWLSTHDADLIFLDINLADGNAFKIFEQIEIRTPIIFTTAYHEYALRAFEQHSIDYLLKPVSREKLRNSLAKLRALQNKPDTDQNFRDLKSLLQTMLAPLPAKRFMVQLGNKVRIVELSEVAYFQAEAKITFLYDRNGRRYPVESSLKQLEEQVPAADFFSGQPAIPGPSRRHPGIAVFLGVPDEGLPAPGSGGGCCSCQGQDQRF